MEDNKDLVTEVTENAGEQTAEEPVEQPKLYTEEELNAKVDELLKKKVGRAKAKMQREFDEEMAKYKDIELVLNAGLKTENIEEATEKMRNFYEENGVTIPQRSENTYTQEEAEVLADYEAGKIIDAGYEEVEEEANRLADKGLDKMTAKEKALFGRLTNHLNCETERRELAKIGIGAEVLEDAEYKEFAKNLNPRMSVKEKYELFQKYKPKPTIEKMGSMTNKNAADNGVKDFYTYEEAIKFTVEDFNRNPELYKAVENSIPKWEK